MIPHRARYDILSVADVNAILAALDLPLAVAGQLVETSWHPIAAAVGIEATTPNPSLDEWNAAVDYANTLIATKENQ